MLFKVKAYLKFIASSKNQYGTHSPFVYDLITQCFYDRTSYTAYKKIALYRRFLKQNQKPSDLEQRLSFKKSKLLNRIVRYLEAKSILDCSKTCGIAAVALSAENNCHTSLLKGNEVLHIQKDFVKNHFPAIRRVQSFKDAKSRKYNLIFMGLEATKENSSAVFNQLLPCIHPEGVIIIDRIHQSAQAEAHWKNIKSHSKTRVTIDLFYMGLVFFKKGQACQHFKIRV